MKDKLKNTLSHEVELLGRSISILALAGLLVVGGASAALLNSFGTVSGDATVSQSITVNGESVEEGGAFSQSWSLNGAVAGESVSSTNNIQNNLDTEQTVYFNSIEDSVPGDSSEDNVDSEDSYSAGHLVLENGETFTNTERVYVEDGDNLPVDSETEAETEYVIDDSGNSGVKASYNPEGGHVHSGLWFDVEPTQADQVTISATGSDQDWLYVVLEYDGQAYVAGDFTSPSSYQVGSGETHIYELSESDIDNIDSRSDFSKESEVSGDSPIVWEDATVHYAVAATGTTGEGDQSSLTYTDFQFNGDSRMNAVPFAQDESVPIPSGESELGTAFDFDLAAYPGDYSYTLEVNPEQSED